MVVRDVLWVFHPRQCGVPLMQVDAAVRELRASLTHEQSVDEPLLLQDYLVQEGFDAPYMVYDGPGDVRSLCMFPGDG